MAMRMREDMEALTRAIDEMQERTPESKYAGTPESQQLARSLSKKDGRLGYFLKKESSLTGWSDQPETTSPTSGLRGRGGPVRVTGFSIPKAGAPLISGSAPSVALSRPPSAVPTTTPAPASGKSAEAGAAGVATTTASPSQDAEAKPASAKKPPTHRGPSAAERKGKGGSGGGGGGKGGKGGKNWQNGKNSKGNPGKGKKQKGTASPSKRKDKKKKKKVPLQYDDPKRLKAFNKLRVLDRRSLAKQKRVPLFSHLPQYEGTHSVSLQVGVDKPEIHPAILRLGVKFSEGVIVGSNARCMGMLEAIKEAIKDFTGTGAHEPKRELMDMVNPIIRFIIDCRPMSPGMGNATRYIKNAIRKLPSGKSLDGCKTILIGKIDQFIEERIDRTDEEIAEKGAQRISDGEVIMTYARSLVVEKVLLRALRNGVSFRVIIVDSRPKYEGRALCRRLAAEGIDCTYVMLSALSYMMKEVSMVMVGASSILANGSVISRVGTATVGMMADVYKVPMIICCETYKFHERVQVGSISFNELGDPEDLVRVDRDRNSRDPRGDSKARQGAAEEKKQELDDWRDVRHLKLLNLAYDLTPPCFVSMVITEFGSIPVTSVPVVLREYMKYNVDG